MDDIKAYAYETIAVPSAAVVATLTRLIYDPDEKGLPVKKATIYVDPGPNIRFTLDGTTATTGTGHQITSFMTYDVYGHENIKNFQTTSTKSGTAGAITVTYFK